MNKVKTFFHREESYIVGGSGQFYDVDPLELKVDKWLAENPGYEVVQVQLLSGTSKNAYTVIVFHKPSQQSKEHTNA